MSRRRKLVPLLVLLVSFTAACGGDDGNGDGEGAGSGAEGDAPFFVPPQPLSAAELDAVSLTYEAVPLSRFETPSDRLGVAADAVGRYRDSLCQGANPAIPPSILSDHDDLPAYGAIFEDVAVKCAASAAVLARERGEIVWLVAQNELRLAKLLRPERSAADRFCDSLEHTSQITPALVANVASETGLVRSSTAAKAIEIGVSVLIKACPQLIQTAR